MTHEGPGTDQVISVPMRGLKKQTDRHIDRQTYRNVDSLTELAHWGHFSENLSCFPTLNYEIGQFPVFKEKLLLHFKGNGDQEPLTFTIVGQSKYWKCPRVSNLSIFKQPQLSREMFLVSSSVHIQRKILI